MEWNTDRIGLCNGNILIAFHQSTGFSGQQANNGMQIQFVPALVSYMQPNRTRFIHRTTNKLRDEENKETLSSFSSTSRTQLLLYMWEQWRNQGGPGGAVAPPSTVNLFKYLYKYLYL
jgi:hypothetical protein